MVKKRVEESELKSIVMKEITSSLKIVAYEPELKSLTAISELRFFTAKSFSKDKTNLITGEECQSAIVEK